MHNAQYILFKPRYLHKQQRQFRTDMEESQLSCWLASRQKMPFLRFFLLDLFVIKTRAHLRTASDIFCHKNVWDVCSEAIQFVCNPVCFEEGNWSYKQKLKMTTWKVLLLVRWISMTCCNFLQSCFLMFAYKCYQRKMTFFLVYFIILASQVLRKMLHFLISCYFTNMPQ